MIKCECKQGLLEASDISHVTPAELFQLAFDEIGYKYFHLNRQQYVQAIFSDNTEFINWLYFLHFTFYNFLHLSVQNCCALSTMPLTPINIPRKARICELMNKLCESMHAYICVKDKTDTGVNSENDMSESVSL